MGASRPEEVWTSIDGRAVRARRPPVTPRAARPVAVLLPGLGLSGDYLLPLARALAPVMPTYVIDLPGSGGCPGPAGRLHARHLGDVVARWLAANRLAGVVLVGNSFGSEVALEAGARAPDRVVALALGAPTPDPRARNLGVQLARLVRAAGPAPWWVVRVALRDYARTGVRRLLREARTALREPVVRRLAAASVPVLVIRGERDPVVPGAWAREAARLARGELAVIPGAGHAALASHPGAVADAIAAFVSRRV